MHTTHPKLYVLSSVGPGPLASLAAKHPMVYMGGWTAAGWIGVVYPGAHTCKSCLAAAGVQTISAYSPATLGSAVVAQLQKVASSVTTSDTAWSAAQKLLAALGSSWEFLDPEV